MKNKNSPINIVGSNKFNPCNCFAPGTLVNNEDNSKQIEKIQVGDLVWSENPDTGDQAYKRVEAVYTRDTNETWNIHIGEEVLTTTDFKKTKW